MSRHVERWADAVAGARIEGARVAEWSFHVSEARRLTLPTRDGETGNAHMPLTLAESCMARYVIVWDDRSVSRGALERRQVESDLSDALAQARRGAYDDPDAAQVVGRSPLPDVRLFDEEAAAIASGKVHALLDRSARIRRCAAEAGFPHWSGSFQASEAHSRLATSQGFEAESRTTHWSWHASLRGEIGCGYSARALETVDDLEARVLRIAAIAPLLDVVVPGIAGGERPVLLHPDVVEELVLGSLLRHLDAATVAHAEGWFRREQFGSGVPVLREDLGVRIDPTLPLRAGSYRFTSEGVPSAPCVFVEAGRLLRPAADLKYARRLGLAPTPLPAGSDTLFLEGPEAMSLQDAYDAAPGGGLVLGVLGVHTLDSASGDFSLSAPQTLHIGAGGPDGRFRATLSGNLLALLRSADLRLVSFPGEPTPGLLVTCRLDPK